MGEDTGNQNEKGRSLKNATEQRLDALERQVADLKEFHAALRSVDANNSTANRKRLRDATEKVRANIPKKD